MNRHISPSVNKENKVQKKTPGSVKWYQLVFGYLIIFIALLVVEEMFLLHSLVPVLLDAWFVELTMVALSFILTLMENQQEIVKPIVDGVNRADDICQVLKKIGYVLYNTSLVWIVAGVMVLVYAPAALADYRLVGRTTEMIREGIDLEKGLKAFQNYAVAEEQEESAEEPGESSKPKDGGQIIIGTEGSEDEESKNADAAEGIPSLAQDDWFKQRPESEQTAAMKLKISESEAHLVYHLSECEYQELFFIDGEYQIENWNDDEHIVAQVSRKIMDLVSQQRENQFDGANGARMSLANDVNQSRIDEENSWELKVKKDSIAVRHAAYQSYPKCSLVRLNSESYNGIALAYFWQCRNSEMAQYYFSQAALDLYECLAFAENSRDEQRELLNSLRQRYADIAFVCSPDREECFYSMKLETALESILLEY